MLITFRPLTEVGSIVTSVPRERVRTMQSMRALSQNVARQKDSARGSPRDARGLRQDNDDTSWARQRTPSPETASATLQRPRRRAPAAPTEVGSGEEQPDAKYAVSYGSVGHPCHCGEPCKFIKKKRGCKDGSECHHCHFCAWRRQPRSKRCSVKHYESVEGNVDSAAFQEPIAG